MHGNTPIFVYGTLLFDEIVVALTGKRYPSLPAKLIGYQRYAVKPPGREGEGPAIVRESGTSIGGRVLLDLDERAIRILDAFEFESPGYTKVAATATVSTKDGSQDWPVWVYEGNQALTDHIVGEWSPERFESSGMERYLQEFIPELLARWATRGGIL